MVEVLQHAASEEADDSETPLFGGPQPKKKREYVSRRVDTLDCCERWLNSELHSLSPQISGLAEAYVCVTVHSAECERGVSALKRIHTNSRNRLSQALLEMLMYINLNGPPIELFDFGYAVQLWLHYANHRVGASAQTTTLQREQALQIQAFPWGVCEIPLEIRGEVSDDSQEEAEEHSEDGPEDNKEEE